VKILSVPSISSCSKDGNDLLHLCLSVDPDVLEEKLDLARLLLQSLPESFPVDIAGIPLEVFGEELSVPSTAEPQDGLGLLSCVIHSGVEEDVDNEVLVPAPAQVDAFALHLL